MSTKAHLLLLCLAQVVILLVLAGLHRDRSEIAVLTAICHGQILTDSSRFIRIAWQTVEAHNSVYRTLFFEQHFKFIYPTSSLFLASLSHLLQLPLDALVRGLVVLSVPGTLLFATNCFLQFLPSEARGWRSTWQVRLSILFLGLTFYPLVISVNLGQLQTVLTFLFTLGVWFWMGRRKAAAGVALALICLIKPQLGLFVLWALFRRQWRFLTAFLVTTVAFQLLAAFLYGVPNLIGYLPVLAYLSRHGEIIAENQSVNGLLERWFHNGRGGYWNDTSMYPPFQPIVYLGTVISSAVLLLIGLVAPVVRRTSSSTADFLLFGLVCTLASPIVWVHHYAFFFVGSIYLFAFYLNHQGRIPLSVMAAFLVLSNDWVLFGRLQDSHLGILLFTYDLFAGLVIIAHLSLLDILPACAQSSADLP